MPRVFVSNVDTALGHNLSRLFSLTAVGSRREDENQDDEAEEQPEEGIENKQEDKQKEHYFITGTMSAKPKGLDYRDLKSPEEILPPIIETGDKKRDASRREAIEKFAVINMKPKWINELVNTEEKESLQATLLACDIIVYDIVSCPEEAQWAIEMLSSMTDTFQDKPKTFIAISSIMTWAKTKVDQDDPEAFLAEDEYRRRKAHPNFKGIIALEKAIIKAGKKSLLKTYVVASGLVYHSGDSIFHYLLKAGWHNESELICYGEGNNIIPTIHMDDLCNIVVEIGETSPENKYLLAIDDSKHSLFEITKAISEALSTGKVKRVSKEQALLNKDLPQSDYDMLLVNLRLEPGHVKDMTFEWKYETGLIENLPQLLQEYKDSRGLSPLKIVLHGPPASSKTFYAKKIAEYYEIHNIEVDEVINEAIERLERRVSGHLNPEELEDDIDTDRELLEEIKEYTKTNNGKYPDEHIVNFLRDKLRSMPCRNQGYILNGFPNNMDEATLLFKSSGEDDKDEKNGSDDLIIPDIVISLECSDDYIKERIMNLPESSIANTKNSEEILLRRLEEFRLINTDENTVLNFFDEIEIHPITFNIESIKMEDFMKAVVVNIGKPHNYGPSREQLAEKRRIVEERKIREAILAEEDRKRREKEEIERHQKAVSEWNTRLEEVRKQEQEVLEAQSVPLRNYLMKYVMPTLTSGLIEVCKVRPEDPIDYLAEFLFKHNPDNV